MLSVLKNIFELLIKASTIDQSDFAIKTKVIGLGSSGNIVEKGRVDVVNVISHIITFSEPRANYIPYVAINDNLNVWFSNLNTNGFTVNFSSPYTGTIYYCIII